MGFLDKILSLFGRGGSDADADRRETTVSVERNGQSEAAVKGSDLLEEEGSETTGEAGDTPETSDVADESATEEFGETGETTGESSETSVEETVDETSVEETDEAGETVDETTADEADATAEASTESVETVKGIGPAYAERLAAVGVETVWDLADADAADLAAEIDLSEKRVGRWIERAREQ
ncbi:MAG: helix-hairpin-helix domain-containing protein [Haloplanus sp.]